MDRMIIIYSDPSTWFIKLFKIVIYHYLNVLLWFGYFFTPKSSSGFLLASHCNLCCMVWNDLSFELLREDIMSLWECRWLLKELCYLCVDIDSGKYKWWKPSRLRFDFFKFLTVRGMNWAFPDVEVSSTHTTCDIFKLLLGFSIF